MYWQLKNVFCSEMFHPVCFIAVFNLLPKHPLIKCIRNDSVTIHGGKANSLFQKISIKNYTGKKIYNSTKFNLPAACISNTTDNYSLS